MYIIDHNGNKIPLDEEKIAYDGGFNPCVQMVSLIDDSLYLKDAWIASGYKNKNAFQSFKNFETEFITEKEFDHEPTQSELIYFMAANGLTVYDFVEVSKVKKLEQKDD